MAHELAILIKNSIIKILKFFKRQVLQIKDSPKSFIKKINLLIRFFIKYAPSFIPILILLIIIRLLKPFLLVRFGLLIGKRIGHFAVNTELYLCEKNESINIPH
jgi:hypothetical protein